MLKSALARRTFILKQSSVRGKGTLRGWVVLQRCDAVTLPGADDAVMLRRCGVVGAV